MRDETIEIRVTKNEKAAVKAVAERSGLGTSTWIRMRLTQSISGELMESGMADEADLKAMVVCAVRYCLEHDRQVVTNADHWARSYGRTYPTVRRTLIRDLQSQIDRGFLGKTVQDEKWRGVLKDLLDMETAEVASVQRPLAMRDPR